jgi:2-hydroxymuconate-semialdehyde hydrolase
VLSQTASVPVDESWVRTGHYRSHLLTSGRGQPVLLLHGGGPGIDAAFSWGLTLPRLGSEFLCLAPDMVGFGRTDLPDKLARGPRAWLDLRVRQALDLLDGLGIQRAFVVGQAAGGGSVALRLMIDAPERVGASVLIGGAGYADSGSKPTVAAAMIRAFYESPSPDGMEAVLRQFSAHPERLDPPIRELSRARCARATAPGAEAAFRAMRDGDAKAAIPTDAELKAVGGHVLLIHGGRDAVVPLQVSLTLQGRLPNAHLHVLPAAGHWSHIDQPDAFLGLVMSFLRNEVARQL